MERFGNYDSIKINDIFEGKFYQRDQMRVFVRIDKININRIMNFQLTPPLTPVFLTHKIPMTHSKHWKNQEI
jgi:hypothetical protein